MNKKGKKKKQVKLKGLIHYCSQCKKRTEHKAQGERGVRYFEYCKTCKSISYSEILRKDWKENGKS